MYVYLNTYNEVYVKCCAHRFVCGSLGYYDVAKEKRISLKSPLPLQSCDRVFHKVTTTDDPIIRRVSGHKCHNLSGDLGGNKH